MCASRVLSPLCVRLLFLARPVQCRVGRARAADFSRIRDPRVCVGLDGEFLVLPRGVENSKCYSFNARQSVYICIISSRWILQRSFPQLTLYGGE